MRKVLNPLVAAGRWLWPVVACACVSLPAHGEEWALATEFVTYTEVNDNPRLATDGGEAVTGVVADLSETFSRRSAVSSLTLAPRFVLRRYTGPYALDGDDYYLDAGYQRGSERTTAGVSAAFSHEGTATSDFVSTGYAEKNIPRELLDLSASAGANLSERSSLTGVLVYQHVTFDGGESHGLYDYDYTTVQAVAQRAMSTRTRLQLISRLGWLDVPQTGARTREATVGIGLDYDWSQRVHASLAIGPSYSEFNGVSNGVSNSYRATLSGVWERTQLDVTAQRILSPVAGRGQLESNDSLALSCTHSLGERWSLSGQFAADFYSNVNDPRYQGGGSRDYKRASAAVSWRASSEWTVSLAATHEERQEAGETGRSNRLSLGATWSGGRRAVSR